MKKYIFLLLCLFSSQSKAQEIFVNLVLDTVLVTENLTVPWDMEWAGDYTIIFTEIDGTIKQTNVDNGETTTLYTFQNIGRELQSGLMGLALSTNFSQDHYAYSVHSYYGSNNQLFLSLVRLSYDPNIPILNDPVLLVDGLPAGSSSTGARLVVTEQEIFLSLGELELGEPAQDINNLGGKILRFNLDGSIPNDNPFENNPVWSYGHRNPQGLTMSPNGILYSSEHGTFNNDELNIIEKGRNYGWPLVNGYCHQENLPLCNEYNVKPPIQVWTPTVAPSGLDFYTGEIFPHLENAMLIACLKEQVLMGVELKDNGKEVKRQRRFIEGKLGRLRDVVISPEGRVFVCTSNADVYGEAEPGSDKIYELIKGNQESQEEESIIIENFDLQLENTLLQVSVVATDLEIPWDMHWSKDEWIWFSERNGNIKRFNPASKSLQLVYTIPDVYESWDNSGLHGFALHPDFPETPYAYAHFTFSKEKSKLVRLEYVEENCTMVNTTVLMDDLNAADSHNGSRILFDEDGKILFALGDAYHGEHSQELDIANGKILRLNPDGSIPDDNPFPESYTWTYGHRNPQGLVFGPGNQLYSSEHGAGNDDELNLINRGGNYGWPIVQGFCDLPSEQNFCNSANVIEPLIEWTPTRAPSGLAYYNHDAIPEWKGSLIQCFLKASPIGQRMKQIRLNDQGNEVVEIKDLFVNTYGRIRDVLVSPDGRVFICTSNQEKNGEKVRKIDDDKIIEIRNPAVHRNQQAAPESAQLCFYLYPNPVKEQINLKFNEATKNSKLVLFNTAGQIIEERKLDDNVFEEVYSRNSLPSGVYYLMLTNDLHRPYITSFIFD